MDVRWDEGTLSRSETQEQARSEKAKGSRFCSNEIKTAVVMRLSLSPRTSCLGFHSAPWQGQGQADTSGWQGHNWIRGCGTRGGRGQRTWRSRVGGPVTFPKFRFDRTRKSQAPMKQPRGIPTLSTDLSLPSPLSPRATLPAFSVRLGPGAVGSRVPQSGLGPIASLLLPGVLRAA